jgi:Zn ribbon nucleic-acid-binding protein
MQRKTNLSLEDEIAAEVFAKYDTPAQELVAKVPTISEPSPLFEKSLWKDTVPVLKCVKCGSFRNESEKDEFILHVLTHYHDEEEKEAVMNRLLKELN